MKGGRSPQKAAILGLVVALVAGLEILGRAGVLGPTVVQPPSEVFPVLLQDLASGEALPHLWRTTWEVLASFFIGTLAGVPFGVLFARFPWLGKVFEPYLVGLYAVPLVLFYPFSLVILGLGAQSVIAVGAAMAFVPVALNVWIGLSEIPPIYISVARVAQCTRWQLATKFMLPAAAPMVFAGLKMGVIYAFIGAVAMEFITADSGLGFLVAYNYEFFDAKKMYAYIFLVLFLSIIMNWLLLLVERKLRLEME